MEYTIGTKVFNKWTIVGDLGEGANGKTFVIEKDDFGVKTRSAMKVIRIPRSGSHIKEVMSEGMDEASVALYFREAVDRLIREVAVMASLKSHPHIVCYEDHEVLPHAGGVGWDILIRMELLTPLPDHLMQWTMTEREVLRLGIELTEALVYCQEKNIIHRDIKPSNVLVNEFGQYKLGDFGVARTLDQTRSGLSHSGTVDYMAPEIYYDRPYGPTVDVYSLGLVLYMLMNGNRLPFLPEAPERIRHDQKEQAKERRLRGDELPLPRYASEAFAQVILRACAYDPRERYRSARELLEALHRVEQGTTKTEDALSDWDVDDEDKTLPVMEALPEEEPTRSVWGPSRCDTNTNEIIEEEEAAEEGSEPDEENEDAFDTISKGMIAVGAILLALLLGAWGWLMLRSQDGWVEKGTKTYYYTDYKKAKGLTTIDGVDYYFDQKGVMQTGQVTDEKYTYYLDEEGRLLYGEVTEENIKTTRAEEAISMDGRRIYAKILDHPLENVMALKIEVTVTEVKEGEPDGQRRVYVRNLEGEWIQIGSLEVSDLHGQGQFVLETPISFDAIVCPESDSTFSGSITQALTEVIYRPKDMERWYLAEENVYFTRGAHMHGVISGVPVSIEGDIPIIGSVVMVDGEILQNSVAKVSLDQLETVQEGQVLVIASDSEERDQISCDRYISAHGERYLIRYDNKHLAAREEGSRYFLSETLTEECWWELIPE